MSESGCCGPISDNSAWDDQFCEKFLRCLHEPPVSMGSIRDKKLGSSLPLSVSDQI